MVIVYFTLVELNGEYVLFRIMDIESKNVVIDNEE
jgi:hypothetical protein